jgi:peptidyl-prolyl cis-trans isomerase A (cyclophilin A)
MLTVRVLTASLAAGVPLLTGCPRDTAPEPAKADLPQTATIPPSTASTTQATAATGDTPAPTPTATATAAAVPKAVGDPLDGKFTIDDATKDIKGTGPLLAKIETSMGAFMCQLYSDKAPITVANFIGLARGIRPFRDIKTGEWVKRPWYDGTTFHRIIKGFMIQGGDPLGTGAGEPGYLIPDELWPGAKHDRAGLLCMANRGHNTNGGQFFITDAAAAHLDNNYTIFGECSPEKLVHDIASVPVSGERPKDKVTIKTVKIERGPVK